MPYTDFDAHKLKYLLLSTFSTTCTSLTTYILSIMEKAIWKILCRCTSTIPYLITGCAVVPALCWQRLPRDRKVAKFDPSQNQNSKPLSRLTKKLSWVIRSVRLSQIWYRSVYGGLLGKYANFWTIILFYIHTYTLCLRNKCVVELFFHNFINC